MVINKKITLSVDCMGGDNSIDDIIGGVNRFCSENNNIVSDSYQITKDQKIGIIPPIGGG